MTVLAPKPSGRPPRALCRSSQAVLRCEDLNSSGWPSQGWVSELRAAWLWLGRRVRLNLHGSENELPTSIQGVTARSRLLLAKAGTGFLRSRRCDGGLTSSSAQHRAITRGSTQAGIAIPRLVCGRRGPDRPSPAPYHSPTRPRSQCFLPIDHCLLDSGAPS